jgi:TrmH family RNA methyltransferase
MLSKSEAKYIQSLKDKKSRAEFGQFMAEGPKIVTDLLNDYAGEIVCIYATRDWAGNSAVMAGQVPFREIEDFELEKISALQTPQQVLAVVKTKSQPFIPYEKDHWILMLDGIQDPGNMGSILRTADWFGIKTIYCTPDTADIYNPKVVQASMGSLLRVNVCFGDCEQWLNDPGVPVYPTLLNGQNIFQTPSVKPGIVIIGNEGRGIRPALLRKFDMALTIPRIGKAESLNAAVATGILLSKLVNA